MISSLLSPEAVWFLVSPDSPPPASVCQTQTFPFHHPSACCVSAGFTHIRHIVGFFFFLQCAEKAQLILDLPSPSRCDFQIEQIEELDAIPVSRPGLI